MSQVPFNLFKNNANNVSKDTTSQDISKSSILGDFESIIADSPGLTNKISPDQKNDIS